MERDELNGILMFGNAGAVFGAIVALLMCRARHPFRWTAAASGLGAPMALLTVVGAAGALESVKRFGFDPTRAVLAAIASCFFAVFALPFICGLPALLTGVAMQTQLQRMRQKNIDLRFHLSTLLLFVAIVPPLLAYVYFEPAMAIIVFSAVIAAFVAVSLAMASLGCPSAAG